MPWPNTSHLTDVSCTIPEHSLQAYSIWQGKILAVIWHAATNVCYIYSPSAGSFYTRSLLLILWISVNRLKSQPSVSIGCRCEVFACSHLICSLVVACWNQNMCTQLGYIPVKFKLCSADTVIGFIVLWHNSVNQLHILNFFFFALQMGQDILWVAPISSTHFHLEVKYNCNWAVY